MVGLVVFLEVTGPLWGGADIVSCVFLNLMSVQEKVYSCSGFSGTTTVDFTLGMVNFLSPCFTCVSVATGDIACTGESGDKGRFAAELRSGRPEVVFSATGADAPYRCQTDKITFHQATIHALTR